MQLLWRTPKTLLYVFKKLSAQEQYMMSSRFTLNTNVCSQAELKVLGLKE